MPNTSVDPGSTVSNPFTGGAADAAAAAMADKPAITSGAGKAVSTQRLLSGAKRVNGGWSVPGLSSSINDQAFMEMLNRSAQDDLQSGAKDDLSNLMRVYGLNYATNGDSIQISGFAGGEPKSGANGALVPNTGTSGTAAGSPLGTGGGQTVSSGGGVGSGGGGGGGGGGAAAGNPYQGLPGWGGGGGGSSGMPIVPGASAGGSDVIDPSKAIGLKPITPSYQPGSSYFGPQGSQFPSAGNPFAGLNENSNLYDVISKIAGSQVGNQQAALDILGGTFKESLDGANSQALRARTGDLLANPYSMDEQTIQRILGKTNEGINGRASQQAAEASQRAASSGLRPDSGVVQAGQNAIAANAGLASAGAERDTRAQAAIQNQQDLRSALASGGQAIDTDLGRRERIGNTAATGVLGQTQITGDAFLTSALLAAQGKQPVPVNSYPRGMTGGTHTVFTG